jgi:glucokinase
MPVIAVDFGGTNIKLGIISGGKLLSISSIPAESHEGIRPRLGQVVSKIKHLLDEQGLLLTQCRCVGIATPGIVNCDERRVIAINKKYDDAVSVDFPKWCDAEFGLPLVMDNDTNCAILGETNHGCARGFRDAVLMAFGTGIGTAAVMNGQLIRGRHYQAGCLGGHLIIDYEGRICTCGNRGCIEALASTSVLHEVARGREQFSGSLLAKRETIDYKAVTDCAGAGDAFSKNLFDYLIRCWGAGIVNLIHAYDPEVIILSGGLMKEQEKVVPPLRQYVVQNAWLPWGVPEFRIAENPDASVLLGLYTLCGRNGT